MIDWYRNPHRWVLDQLDPMLSGHYRVDYKLLITKASFSRETSIFSKNRYHVHKPTDVDESVLEFQMLIERCKG